jgi:hypothetical protein
VAFEPSGGAPRIALGDDGRVLVGWIAARDVAHPVPTAAYAAAGTLAGGLGAAVRLSGPVRDVTDIAPLRLADGSPAVAWIDNGGNPLFPRGGRLHLATAAAAPVAQPSPPRISLRAPRRVARYGDVVFRVRAGCDRACDLRVSTREWSHVWRLPSAGRTRMRVPAVAPRPGHARRLVVRAVATGPGGRQAVAARAVVRVLRLRPPRGPAIRDLHAVRAGRRVVVTWRTDRPARSVIFIADALRAPHAGTRHAVAFDSARGRGRTQHRVVLGRGSELHRGALAGAGWIRVEARSSLGDGGASRQAFTRIR